MIITRIGHGCENWLTILSNVDGKAAIGANAAKANFVPQSGHREKYANQKGRPHGTPLSKIMVPKLNAWRTGSSYGLSPYRTSYAQQHGCRV
jgi:hypothetical protein